jgi:hypothetical protein
MDAHEKPGQGAAIPHPIGRAALRSFGLTFAVVFTLFGVFFWWKSRPDVARGFWTAAAAFGLVAFTFPGLLLPLHGPWMRFAEILGRINTKLLLGLFYFTGMTVVGGLMRLFGKDPMARRPKPRGESYWIRSTDHASGRRHFEQQF